MESGHVAGWVGVGGPGQGPGGTNEWLQVGLNSLPGTGNTLYYEVMRPGEGASYHELDRDVASGRALRVAVLETSTRANAWRIWVNGKAVTGPIDLAGSHGALTPMAMAESWDGGRPACNRYSYRFERVALASAPGGPWQVVRASTVLQDAGYRVVRRTQGSFDAAATRALPVARTAAPEPTAARTAAAPQEPTATTRKTGTSPAARSPESRGAAGTLSPAGSETPAVQVITARPIAVSAPLRKGFVPAPSLERLLVLFAQAQPLATGTEVAVEQTPETVAGTEPLTAEPAAGTAADTTDPALAEDAAPAPTHGLDLGLGGSLVQASELEPALA